MNYCLVMSKQIYSVMQLHQGYNIKPIDVSDLAEQVIKALPQEQYSTTTLFVSGRPGINQKDSCAQRTIYLNLPRKCLRGLRLGLTYQMYKLFQSEKFDVVICNRFKPTSIMMWLYFFVGKPKCITIVHNLSDYRPIMRKLWIRFFARNWNFVAVSESVRDGLIAMKCGFSGSNVTLIENALDSEQMSDLLYTKEVSRQRLDLPMVKTVVGTIGRLEKVKGHVDLIRGFAKIHQKFPDVIVAIIGDGKERKKLELEIAAKGLAGKVILLGAVDGAAQFIKAFDIWIMPSHSEGLPLALMEAMTAELPILTTAIPSMKYIVEPSGGVCFDVQNPDSLAEALSACLQLTVEERAEMGKRSLDYLGSRFSLKKYRREYLRLIERVLDDR